MTEKTRVLFLIRSLASGGAERQLSELVRHMDPTHFEIHLAVFYDPGYHNNGAFWPELEAYPDVTLHSLHKRKGPVGYLTALPRLFWLLRRLRPQVIHGYGDGNLPALLVGRLVKTRAVWGIRQTSVDLSKPSRWASWFGAMNTRLSRSVDLIIFNSEAGRIAHERVGIRGRRAQVIPNGFDVARFVPDPAEGSVQRRAWGVPDEAPLIGIVGRLDPVKDHPTFLRAAARLGQEWPTARFVCIGGGTAEYTDSLKALAHSLGISDRVLWPGVCGGMSAAYNALSLLVVSSRDEGFPNVIGEAMACGIPCVSTRVGDAALLMGDTGKITDVADDAAIADAVSDLLRESPEARGARSGAARSRICGTFSVQALARHTEQALVSLLPGAVAAFPMLAEE